MKKLITLTVVVLFATTTFAQEMKMDPKIEEGKTEVGAAKPMMHECYMMKNGHLVHCIGTKAEPQKTEVSLKNGTVITSAGDVKMKDGKSVKLENGQCISMMGSIGDCEKMHSATKVERTLENDQVKDVDSVK